jgi:hypothetical protein
MDVEKYMEEIQKQLGKNRVEVPLIAQALQKKFRGQQTISILPTELTNHVIFKTISHPAQKVLWDILKSKGCMIGILPQDMSFVINGCVKFYMSISRVLDAPKSLQVRLFADVFESFKSTKTYSIYVDKWNYSEDEFQCFANVDDLVLEIQRMITIVC